MSAEEIAKYWSIPEHGEKLEKHLGEELGILSVAHLDLLAKQEGAVLVPDDIVDRLMEAYNGGAVKNASLYEIIVELDKVIIAKAKEE